MHLRSLLCLLGLTLAAAVTLRAATLEEVIAKARAHLGTEEALEAINSVCYSGTVQVENENHAGTIEIIYQKPSQYRLKVTTPEREEVIAIDGLEGWSHATFKDGRTSGLQILRVPELRRLRMNAWEVLYFFKPPVNREGKAELMGEAVIDSRDCWKIFVRHYENITLTRYFDRATGELVMTETELGGQMREQGEIMVNGVRFPKELIATLNGKTTNYLLDKVVVNEVYPPELFAVPAIPPR